MNNQIAFSRKQVVEVLRVLEELVVSLDRIGSASVEMTKPEGDAALADFIRRHGIFRKTAKARRILSEPFASTAGPDGMDELEREMEGVRYWAPKMIK